MDQSSQIDASIAWADAFKDYFLGFIPQDELEAKLRVLYEAHPDLKDPVYRKLNFETYVKHLLVPPNKHHKHILDRIGRRFFIGLQELQERSLENSLPIIRTKYKPDNCSIFDLGNRTFDVRCMEEHGFVRTDKVLVNRTFQPFLRYASSGEIDKEHPVTDPTTLIIPAQSELEFFESFPFTRIANQDGITFTGIFQPITLNQQFIDKLNLKTETALACIAYKTTLVHDPSASFKPIKLNYLNRVIHSGR